MLDKTFYRPGAVVNAEQIASHAASAKFQATTLALASTETGFGEIRDWGKSKGIVLSVCFFDAQGRVESHSSAVMVGPGVALCAWHALEERIQEFVEGEKDLYCLSSVGSILRMWQVHEVTDVPGTDIAILGMELKSLDPADTVFHQYFVNLNCPAVGDALTAVGTIAMNAEFLPDIDGAATVGLRPKWSTGRVVDAFLAGTMSRPFPHLWVELASFGGMSGGPVFDKNGFLVGLVSKSFHQIDKDDGKPTLVSLLFPALVFPFKGGWPASRERTRTLLEDPEIALHGREKVVQCHDLSTGKTTWRWPGDAAGQASGSPIGRSDS